MQDLSVFDKMTSLVSLNISEHSEFFKSEEDIKQEQIQQKEGTSDENIEFVSKLHDIDELLSKLNSLRKLECDEDLEDYILENHEKKGFLPNLKEINRVPMKYSDLEERGKEKKIRRVMDKIWMYVGTYRIVSESQMDEENAWYLMDEVGSSMRHSDDPNFAIHPFIYSPNNKLDA